MPRLRTFWVLAALSAVVALLFGSATANASSVPQLSEEPPTEQPESLQSGAEPASPTPQQQAETTLAAVEAALEEAPAKSAATQAPSAETQDNHVRDLTPLMIDLRRQLPLLSREDRSTAVSYLGRPTQGRNDPQGNGYKTSVVNTDCPSGEGFCVNWVNTTSDAPRSCDTLGLCRSDPGGVAQQISDTKAVMSEVWQKIVTDGGYRAPRRDKGAPSQGTNSLLDVYLVDIGDGGYYGYCDVDSLPRASTGRDAPGYCVLDNDYDPAQFTSAHSPLDNLRVTAAHEFFHAVQFAYDVFEDRFLLEGTAAWVEDQVYDDVDDNVQYLNSSPLRQPYKSLDSNDLFRWYGTWAWWRYLSETYPADGGSGLPVVIRAIWERADNADPKHPGTYSLAATAGAIKARGSVFYRAFARFGEVTRHPQTFFDEAAENRYPHSYLAASRTLTSKNRGGVYKQTLSHLSSKIVGFNRGAGIGAGWRLQVKVDTPHPKRGLAQLTSYDANGVPKKAIFIPLNRKGVGSATVAFNANVQRVELTLTNSGRRYKCNRGTPLACNGKSLDNNAVTYFRARAFR